MAKSTRRKRVLNSFLDVDAMTLFLLPIYPCSPSERIAADNRAWDDHWKRIETLLAHPPNDDDRRTFRYAARPRGRIDDIIGFVRIISDGVWLSAQLWFTTAKRVVPGGRHALKLIDTELFIHGLSPDGSTAVFLKRVRESLERIRDHPKVRHRFLDSATFDNVAHALNWRKVLRPPSQGPNRTSGDNDSGPSPDWRSCSDEND